MTLQASPIPRQTTGQVGQVLRRIAPALSPRSSGPASNPPAESAEEYFQRLHGNRATAYQPQPGADPNCPDCGGLGWLSPSVPIGHPLFGRLAPCACTAAARAAQLQQVCGLTDLERQITLDQIKALPVSDTARMVEAVRKFSADPVGLLVIQGSCGNGKSMALWAAVNACLARNIEAVYTTYQAMLDYIMDAYQDDEKATARLARFQNAQVLAIDEFGHDKVKATEWVLKQEAALIDWRHRYGLSRNTGTIIAMNESLDRLPDNIQSRLRDGRNIVIVNNDPDVRPYLSQPGA